MNDKEIKILETVMKLLKKKDYSTITTVKILNSQIYI